jgi:hypothetical protein
MTIDNKTYTIDTLVENAVKVIKNIDAANIDKTPSFDSTFNDGYRWGADTSTFKDRSYTMTTTSDSQKFNGWLKTSDTIPSNLKSTVLSSTVESQFRLLLKNRGITDKNLKGKLVSVRTVQAIVDTILQFIVARYQLWLNAGGTKSIILYDSSNVSYPGIYYNPTVSLTNDTVYSATSKVTHDSLNTLMECVVSAGLSSLKAKRQSFQAASITSSNTSSCCSSSCSSSSCSSSSCSSSCSCSTLFIAYMKLC